MNALHAEPSVAALPVADAARQAQDRFDALMPQLATRLLGNAEAARQAAEYGGFVLNDSTVVMRLNEESGEIEFFCDVGLPLRHSLEATQRAALELNLCRSYPGVTFGMHPESGRLVATTALPVTQVADDEACLQALLRLTGLCKDLRANRTFLVADEEDEAR